MQTITGELPTDPARDVARARPARRAGALVAAAAAALLAACSSGSGNGVNIGSGSSSNDTVSPDYPIAYIKRALPDAADPAAEPLEDDLRVQRVWNGPADVWLRERSAPSALEKNITERITEGEWDVRDLDVSPDARKLVFAMRPPLLENADESEQPKWAIYEYEVATDTLRRVIQSDIVASEGHDVSPHYLPDGRIVFSSTRQRQAKAVLLDEGKPQFEALDEDRSEPAFVLHVMNADGSGIRQVSFNASHDRDATVLSDGRLMWSRWDHAPGRNGIHLYTANPDGTGVELLYGANSHATGTDGQAIQFVHAREMQDGRVLALVRPFAGTDFGGDLVVIDAKTYVENAQPTLANAGMRGPAQSRATPNEVLTIPGPSPGGRFNSAFPLWDGTGRILVSWNQCRLLDATASPARIVPCTSDRLAAPGATAAPPLYSVWMFDPGQNTLQPVMQPVEGVMVTDVVAAQPRTEPRVILDKLPGLDLDADLVAEGVGVLHIRSVYDFDGTDTTTAGIAALADPRLTRADQRPARFVRLEKPVSQPDPQVRRIDPASFGATPYMREILGYAPVEPDGSVRIKVPANVAFQVSVLDADGRRISPVHRAWLQVRAGEVVQCNGCHAPGGQSPRSHGRQGLFAAVNTGARTTGQPFPNTVPAFSPDAGETMAQTRARTSCASDVPRCRALAPSVDVSYEDVWTDPVAAGRPADASFALRYADLRSPMPTSADCTTRWSATCRIVIHYERHIHPLWSLPRPVLAADGVTVVDDHACTGCHSPRDAANAARVPAGQLDLSDAPSDEQPLQKRAYRELLFTDNAQDVNMGALQDILVPGPVDPATGRPTFVTVPVAAPMTAGSARASTRFFGRFAAGGSHAGWLSAAELRLLSEWLDIGAQYYNDPFAAPLD